MRNRVLALLCVYSAAASAAEVTVNFKANLLATTCAINLVVGSNQATNQTLDFGILTWADIEARGSNTRKDFSLQYSGCYITQSGKKTTQTLDWIQTKVTASNTWSGFPTEMKGASDVAVAGILYRTADLNTAISLNNKVITWSSTERGNSKLPLSLLLRPTSASSTQHSGLYNATLTFVTTYQ